MADALISPVVGGAFWIASGALIGYSAKKIAEEKDNSKTPLMGVLGAFVFAAQMINFSIPGTGSSGHIGGGLLLTALLGPYRAFIAIASVLTIQCLFFADGGILALGCNIFNLGFFPAFIAYPFIYKLIIGNKQSPGKLAAASIVAADAGLLMGAFSVVVQTLLSGISELPFGTFVLVMLPIHFAIGIVEGLVVWAVLAFVARTEPALLVPANASSPLASLLRRLRSPRWRLAAYSLGLPHQVLMGSNGLCQKSLVQKNLKELATKFTMYLAPFRKNLLSCPITHSRLQRQRQRNMRKKRRSPLHRSALEQAWLALLAVS
jgi:ABC-type Co2+ transport system permease subunit